MNLSLVIFLFLWIGLPIVWLALTILFFILDFKAKKKMLAEQPSAKIKKARVTKVFFIIFLVMFVISASLSIALLVFLSFAAKNM